VSDPPLLSLSSSSRKKERKKERKKIIINKIIKIRKKIFTHTEEVRPAG
jgi:hypothetical protein